MPRGDRTGPAGAGPRTGRAAGFCAGNGAPGFMSGAPVRGFGRRRGFGGGGWGWRNGFNISGLFGWGSAPANPDSEKTVLENQADRLQSELESIRKRLSEIESDRS